MKWQIVTAALCIAVFGILFSRQTSANFLIAFGVLLTCSNNWMSMAFHAYQPELFPTPIRAQHACDPITEEGWRVLATNEIVGTTDSPPYRAGAPGDWFVDRTTTLLPLCNYFSPVGSYSLRSYSLDPTQTTERVAICRTGAHGGSVAIPPYAGPCPPR